MRKETELIFKAIAHSFAKEATDGVEPDYSSHGEDFHDRLDEFQEIEKEKYESLMDSYRTKKSEEE